MDFFSLTIVMTIPIDFLGSCYFGELDNFKNFANDEQISIADLERALIVSAGRDHTDIVAYILDNFNISGSARNNEALVRAVQNGNLVMTKLLLDSGADLTARDNLAIGLAVQADDRELLRLFNWGQRVQSK